MPIQGKEEIAPNIAELMQAVRDASLNYDIWWVCKAKGSRERYIEAIRKYPPLLPGLHRRTFRGASSRALQDIRDSSGHDQRSSSNHNGRERRRLACVQEMGVRRTPSRGEATVEKSVNHPVRSLCPPDEGFHAGEVLCEGRSLSERD